MLARACKPSDLKFIVSVTSISLTHNSENEFLNPISQSDFVGVQAMSLALLLASRVARAPNGPEGGCGPKGVG